MKNKGYMLYCNGMIIFKVGFFDITGMEYAFVQGKKLYVAYMFMYSI